MLFFRGNVEKACATYINFTKNYNCTPLQVELFKAIILSNHKEELLENVENHTALVHGKEPTKVALIAAIAECGKESLLADLLSVRVTNLFKVLITFYISEKCPCR